MRIGAALALVGALLAGAGAARADAFTETFTAELYAGRIAAADGLARDAATGDPADATPQAALGLARFLGAAEGLIQGLHRYGLNNGRNGYGALAMAGLPFLRLPVPDNPAPEPVSYRALKDVLDRFAADLAGAEAVLDAIGDGRVALELDLARIRLDLDGDGQAGPDETLLGVFSAVSRVRPGAAEDWVVDLDGADAAWLQAYANLLMAMTDFLLAHDWEAAYDATFEGLFPKSFTPQTMLNAMTRLGMERLPDLQARIPEPPGCQLYVNGKQDADCQAKFRAFEEHPAQREMRSLREAAEYGSIADLIAFVHLMHWPVEDPERLKSALEHARNMVRLSRETWRRVLTETDDAREWLPGPTQTGIFPSMPIDRPRLAGWMEFLDLMDGVLEGKLLLPHWRFAQGFNLRRMVEEPQPFDAVMLAHGAGVLPYLEDGPIADRTVWNQAINVFGGDFFSYFIWIN